MEQIHAKKQSVEPKPSLRADRNKLKIAYGNVIKSVGIIYTFILIR